MPTRIPQLAFTQSLMAHFSPPTNALAMSSTQPFIDRCLQREAEAVQTVAAVHHEGILIRRLAVRLHDWLRLAKRPIEIEDCAEWIAIMLDLERDYRKGK